MCLSLLLHFLSNRRVALFPPFSFFELIIPRYAEHHIRLNMHGNYSMRPGLNLKTISLSWVCLCLLLPFEGVLFSVGVPILTKKSQTKFVHHGENKFMVMSMKFLLHRSRYGLF